MAAPVRGTQSLVVQMGWVFRRPSLTAMELAWRWVFGIPVLVACALGAARMLVVAPLDAAGLSALNPQNPWDAALRLAGAWELYRPHVLELLRSVVPAAAAAWVVLSALGRSLVMGRMEPGLRQRPLSMIALQAAWLAALAVVAGLWFRSMQWAAETHISVEGEPDLVGYAGWAIFLTLGFFTLWSLVSWPVSIAPHLMMLEDCSAATALGRAFRLGGGFNAKLIEVNLVMGIVKLALLVLSMVISAAPLPFSDELGSQAMHAVWAVATLFYLVASDYFQVVRLKAFVEFWRHFRGAAG